MLPRSIHLPTYSMTSSYRLAIVILAATVLLWAGCSKGPPAPASLGPAVSVIDEDHLAAEIERHRGKVVLVDFWATWCPECLELMPHTVELQRALGEDRLAVILVSLDSRGDLKIVLQTLARNGVAFDSYLSRYGDEAKSSEVFNIERATLPNIRVYDRAGTLRKTFAAGRMPPEPFDAEDIEKTVRDLAAEKPDGLD
jgi:thiol-disulfide isomerase/thioredoxin